MASLLLAGGAVMGSAPAAGARVARVVSLSETGHLRPTSSRVQTINETLDEMGSASGTIVGTIYIRLRIVSINRVTAEIGIYPSGGSISGQASASYHVVGGSASFSGTMNVTRGTGRFAHARASGLGFSGTIQRSSSAITVYLSGKLSE